METLNLLKRLKREKKITTQEYRTYKGQVLSGNEQGALKGLRRKRIIGSGEHGRKSRATQ